jgi:enoyl-[acyl-carrier protein] reductase II
MGMRGLRSPFSDKYLEMERSGASRQALDEFATGSSRKVAEEGIGPDGMNGIVQVGESLGPLKKIQPAAAIIDEVMAKAEETLLHAADRVHAESSGRPGTARLYHGEAVELAAQDI